MRESSDAEDRISASYADQIKEKDKIIVDLNAQLQDAKTDLDEERKLGAMAREKNIELESRVTRLEDELENAKAQNDMRGMMANLERIAAIFQDQVQDQGQDDPDDLSAGYQCQLPI